MQTNQKTQKKVTGWKMVLLIQAMVFLYSLTSMLSKVASNAMAEYGFWSWQYILLFGSMIAVLGIYAVLWQQVLKKVDLITAYVHKSTTLIWSLLWATALFRETVRWNNVLGIIIIVIGIVLVTKDD